MNTIKRLVALAAGAALSVGVVAGTADAAKGGGGGTPTSPSSSITLVTQRADLVTASADQGLRIGDTVSYATTIEQLSGPEWPMVSTMCRDAAGNVLWAELAQPDATFTLGGAISPWYESGAEGTCEATLWAYSSKGGRYTSRALASTPSFTVSG